MERASKVINDIKSAFSVEDFCERFGIGRTAAYAELKAGRLKAQKCGRRTLIPRNEAERWLAGLPAM
jgi:excisionase family DNA binding protein